MAKKGKSPKRAKTFIDGLDSYTDEYERWKRTDVIRGLVGVHELPESEFYSGTIEDRLKAVGHEGYSVLYFDSGNTRSSSPDTGSVGTGCASAIRDGYGRVRPIIFVRSEVEVSTDTSDETYASVSAAIRLLVLIHELGHAEDIALGVNFDHDKLTLNHAGAEEYAHAFVIKHAKRMNYRLALQYYLSNFPRWAESDKDEVRLAVEAISRSHDMVELEKWAAVGAGGRGYKEMVERARRVEDVHRHNRKSS